MGIDPRRAASVLDEEAARAEQGDTDKMWVEQIERLSAACEGKARTYIAFLGTAMLAKVMDLGIDAFSVKAKSDQPGAYSARSLCHGVLVPAASRLGISLGATGREPLNNMPFFRMHRLDDGTPIHGNARPAFDMLHGLALRLQSLRSEEDARAALRSFIHVRRRRQPIYASIGEGGLRSAGALAMALEVFVGLESEGGRRAQAAVAGLLDVTYGPDRVETGRVNDPSRKYPGDVCVRPEPGSAMIEKAFEVRDKVVQQHDVQIFAQRCVTSGVREISVVAVGKGQTELPDEVGGWAKRHGASVSMFYEWSHLIDEALFWAPPPTPDAAALACEAIHARLIELEVSPEGVAEWARLAGRD